MTTRFYSLKQERNVTVPNRNVCGYRMMNTSKPLGWQSGLRAKFKGENFSRFSTDQTANEAKSACEGNMNMMNPTHGPPRQVGVTDDAPNVIMRPVVSLGTISEFSDPGAPPPAVVQGDPPKFRSANFLISDPAPRVVDIEAQQLLLAKALGQRVTLSDQSLKDLFQVNAPDPTDTTFLLEGRPQRRVPSLVNLGAAHLDVSAKLDLLKQITTDSRVESKADRDRLAAELIKILASVGELSALGGEKLQAIMDVLDILKVPTDWKAFGFQDRIIDGDFYNANLGKVMLYLINARGNRSINKPVMNAKGKGFITLASTKTNLSRKDANNFSMFFLDLENRRLFTRKQVTDAAVERQKGKFLGFSSEEKE